MEVNCVTSELTFLMSREKVDDEVTQKLVDAGIETVKQLAALVSTQEDLTASAKNSLGSGNEDLAQMAKLSRLVCAWNVAKNRTDKVAEMEGVNSASDLPKKLMVNDFSAMKGAFENEHWPLSDRKTPARAYLEKKLEMVEKGTCVRRGCRRFRSTTLETMPRQRWQGEAGPWRHTPGRCRVSPMRCCCPPSR